MMNMPIQTPIQTPKVWYREPWPWLLMAGPLIVIVAGIYTAWLAVTSSDGLVADDYYKKGLAVGETLAKSRKAEELGIVARLRLTHDNVRVSLDAVQPGLPVAPVLILTLTHPTRAGIDQISQLKREGNAYIGSLNLPASGHWLVVVEDAEKTWRLTGGVMLPAPGDVLIGGNAAAKPAGS